MNWSICIFSQNSAAHLPTCVRAIEDAASNPDTIIYIIDYGSKDDSVEIAKMLAHADPRIKSVQTPIADKATAWNDYIHRLSGTAKFHIFVDARAQIGHAALGAIEASFSENSNARAVAALPIKDRRFKRWRARIIEKQYICSFLYGIRHHTLQQFRSNGLFLPVGAIGEDRLLTYALSRDFTAQNSPSFENRIAVAEQATFYPQAYKSAWSEIKNWYDRHKRFSCRYIQQEIIFRALETSGLGALPDRMDTILTRDALRYVKPRLNIVDYLPDRQMLTELKAQASK